MNTCSSCRRWLTHNLMGIVAPPYHAVDVVDSRGWGICALTASTSNEPGAPDTKAFAVDEDDYASLLVTAPDFGCVQWESPDARAGKNPPASGESDRCTTWSAWPARHGESHTRCMKPA